MSAAGDDALLRGLRILVVEDSFLFAEIVAENLRELGCEVVGPAPRLARALTLARDEALDLALLDINLGGEYSFAVAELLEARGIGFLFLTGYDAAAILPPQFRDTPALTKPFSYEALREALLAYVTARHGGGAAA